MFDSQTGLDMGWVLLAPQGVVVLG